MTTALARLRRSGIIADQEPTRETPMPLHHKPVIAAISLAHRLARAATRLGCSGRRTRGLSERVSAIGRLAVSGRVLRSEARAFAIAARLRGIPLPKGHAIAMASASVGLLLGDCRPLYGAWASNPGVACWMATLLAERGARERLPSMWLGMYPWDLRLAIASASGPHPPRKPNPLLASPPARLSGHLPSVVLAFSSKAMADGVYRDSWGVASAILRQEETTPQWV